MFQILHISGHANVQFSFAGVLLAQQIELLHARVGEPHRKGYLKLVAVQQESAKGEQPMGIKVGK
jgi:hypothetical protein